MSFDSIYNSVIFRGYRYIVRNFIKKNNIDISKFSTNILHDVKNIPYPLFPMFGTLLSIYRDKKFLYADDFDFAIIDNLNINIIYEFEKLGFELCSLSTIGEKNHLVELSFQKIINNIKIKTDVFKLTTHNDIIRHSCPNFRTGKGKFKLMHNLKICEYDSYFNIDYPKFHLVKNNLFNILIPSNPEELFEKHYGHDWNIKKSKNFINYNYYQFHYTIARTITGTPIALKKYIDEYVR